MVDKTPKWCQAEFLLNPKAFCDKPRTVTFKLAKPITIQIMGASPTWDAMHSCDEHANRMEFQLRMGGHEPTTVKV
jgi:hypothetical protein